MSVSPRKELFDLVRPWLDAKGWTSARIAETDAFCDRVGLTAPENSSPAATGLTLRVLTEIVWHEAIVQEAYRDSKNVWTWSAGITDASGHHVGRYKDNPQPIGKCLEIYVWLLREAYLPAVLKAFEGRAMTEAQLAAALSFHWNTGAILQADWVQSWRAGNVATARREFLNWKNPASIIPRREAERDLFFDGAWAGDGTTMLWPVKKPSYTPDWSRGRRINVSAELEALL